MAKITVSITLTLLLAISVTAGRTKTALFVRNNGGPELKNKINTFNDRLAANLAGKGVAVMSWKDVIQKFREASYSEDQIFKDAKAVMAFGSDTAVDNKATTMDKSGDSRLRRQQIGRETSSTLIQENERQSALEQTMTADGPDGGTAAAAALRIAQMLGANYLIVASMGDVSREHRSFKGEGTSFKTSNEVDIFTMPMTARVLDGGNGAAVFGESITAADRIYQNGNLKIETNAVPDKLIETGTAKIAAAIAAAIENAGDDNSATVEFSVDCNVSGADILLDGAAIGSAPGDFSALPGPHQLKVEKQYFQPWERTVNIFPGQKLTVTLEFTTEGQAKFKDLAAFNQSQELEKDERLAEVDIAKQQSDADADAKEKVSSGQEQMMKQSYIRDDGFAQQLEWIIHGK